MESDSADEDLQSNTKESHFSLRMAFSIVKWLKLIGINLVAFGLDLCSSAGFTYVPPLLLKSGFTEELMTIIMGIGPFISLFLVPIIGRWSDNCESKMGRRRPFILFLSLLMLVSLAVIPYSNEINNLFSFGIKGTMFVLAMGIILLDFTSQALQNPCKALISDILISSHDQELGFTVYSCMLSLGGCIGYFISSLYWGSTNLGQLLGSQEKVVFISLAVLFVIFLLVNLFLAQETVYHPIKEELPIVINGCEKVMNNGNKISLCHNKNIVTANGININGNKNEPFLNGTHVPFKKLTHCNGVKLYAKNTVVETFHKSKCTFSLCLLSLKKFSHKTIGVLKIPISSVLWCVSAPLNRILSPWLKLHGFIYMPRHLFRLFVVSLFSWMAIMCHDMFYTDFVGQFIYQGQPLGEGKDHTQELYDEGVRMGSWGLWLHCLSAAIYAAIFQDKIIKQYGQRTAFIFAMACYTLSMGGTMLTTDVNIVNIFSALAGIGLGAATTIPYSLLTTYYTYREIYYPDCKRDRGLGEDMAVLDAAFYLSQIILSLVVGHIVKATGTVMAYMVIAAICGALSCYSATFIAYPPYLSH